MLRWIIAITLFTLSSSVSASHSLLLFTKTLGWRHQSIEAAIQHISAQGAARNIIVEHTEAAENFTLDNLSKYSAVVFLLTTGDILNTKQQGAFEQYIKNGGGFVGVHSATDTEHHWPWYNKLVGAYFKDHPNHPNVRAGQLSVSNVHHPATRALPKLWQRQDEWYDLKDFNPSVSVLLTIDQTSYKKPTELPESGPRPMAWYHHYDGGRAFYTALGHTAESYQESLFIQHLWGGIDWVIKERGNLQH